MAFTYTKRADGRLMKRVSVNGKLETLYSNNPKDLEKQYIEKKSQCHKGISIDDEGMSVSDWSDKWVDLYKSDKESATIKMYKDAIRLYIKPTIGEIKIKKLKQSDILYMLNVLEKKGITRKKEVALLTIKQILDKAVENDYIYKNVARGVKQKKHIAKEKEPLTELEISYLKKASSIDSRCFPILFMLYTGIRKEELAPLIYKDIDIENKLVSINKAVHWENNKPQIKSTKNGTTRKVPILDIIYDNIKILKETHKDNELLFPSVKNNSLMTETSIRRLLEYTLKRINELYKKDQLDTQKGVSENEIEIKTIKFTYHQLRHTYVCMLHKADVPVKEAQYLTGHKSINVLLNIYTHLDSEDKQNATQKLNNLLKI